MVAAISAVAVVTLVGSEEEEETHTVEGVTEVVEGATEVVAVEVAVGAVPTHKLTRAGPRTNSRTNNRTAVR